MNEKQYVQYKNDPNGTKWEVLYDYPNNKYLSVTDGEDLYHVPRQDYIPSAPPERWVDVTAECEYHHPPHEFEGLTHNKGKVYVSGGYRFRKVNIGQYSENKWAFIVEKRED